MEDKQQRVQSESNSAKEGPYSQIKKNLEAQKKAILAESGVILGSGLNPKGGSFPDPGDQATAETNQNFTLRLRGREQKLLKKIEEAIQRISAGTYGICESCEEEISLKRLEVRPVATFCIACKTQQEVEEQSAR